MSFTITWNLAGDLGPGAPPVSGSTSADAMERVTKVIAANSSGSIGTSVGDVAKLRFLVLGASRYTDLGFAIGSGPVANFSGAALVSGDMARLLGALAPATITVLNTGSDDVTIDLLLYGDP